MGFPIPTSLANHAGLLSFYGEERSDEVSGCLTHVSRRLDER